MTEPSARGRSSGGFPHPTTKKTKPAESTRDGSIPARSEAGPEWPGAEGAESGRREPIVRLDDVTVAAGRRVEFLELFESRYLPGARERGLELASTLLSPPIDEPALESNVLFSWRLPGVDAFWRARRGAIVDPDVVRFWADVAPLVVRRARRFSQAGEAGTEAPDPGAPLPTGRVHYLFLLEVPRSSKWARRLGASLPEGVDGRVGRHLPGSIGGADASWEVDVRDGARVFIEDLRADAASTDVKVVDTVVLGRLLGGGVRAPDLRDGIKRTLLLRVEPGAPDRAVDEFECALLGMPRHIPAIRNWRLSRVATSNGGWTHAWEQEYEELSGLKDDYMNCPYHWAFVDGWFDAEDPRCIVTPELFHVFYEIGTSILSGGAAA